MALENFKPKKEDDKKDKDEEGFTRRDFLKILGGAGAAAAVSYPLVNNPIVRKLDKLQKENWEEAEKEREKYRENVHFGEAVVLKKTTDPGGLPGAGGVIAAGALGNAIGGMAAGGAFASNRIAVSMNNDKYYLVIQVEGAKPFPLEVLYGRYLDVKEGEKCPVKYHIDPEHKDEIDWADLFPRDYPSESDPSNQSSNTPNPKP